jgi:hypothetical protein
MNWTPETLRAEMDYRAERALGDRRTTFEQRRAAMQAHPSWWRRYRANHATHHDESDRSRAA